MPDYIAVYDLKSTNPDPYSMFIAEASKKGWSAFMWGPQAQQWFHLPNTTLVGQFQSRQAAVQAFHATTAATAAAIKIPVTVEKFLIAGYHDAEFNSDVRLAPQAS
ncbi:hypothetical protein ELI30_09005 [Rhizobium leguminosarum]|uniref:hypothetical protein n=1 Tax=Rhizobium leguminosarum TaxID=384 RepID=UPI0010306B14|nr:hypothetical protein [Rhizobium leguminosarum]TAV48428.1 hypothetical protein ELI32_09460 [Rhizobium leguminosarum]TAV57928.1 hypothetical protein ELI31_08990 [Rhizobium leguminosarum]TAV68869.1 hypothetical protein ELI30_09005 [Rhizobium leguminosarum]